MAEQTVHDVDHLKESVGTSLPIDDIAQTTTVSAAGNGQAHTKPTPFEGLQNERADADRSAKEQEHYGLAASKHAIPDVATLQIAKSGETLGDTIERPTSAADASGGSDTDNSRADAADLAHGAGMGHVRSNSVKKPTTFKSVSVTKNFLAKAAVAAPNVRPGEKGEHTWEGFY
jgi:uncharacterized cupredoxin-like copper-binding protein